MENHLIPSFLLAKLASRQIWVATSGCGERARLRAIPETQMPVEPDYSGRH